MPRSSNRKQKENKRTIIKKPDTRPVGTGFASNDAVESTQSRIVKRKILRVLIHWHSELEYFNGPRLQSFQR